MRHHISYKHTINAMQFLVEKFWLKKLENIVYWSLVQVIGLRLICYNVFSRKRQAEIGAFYSLSFKRVVEWVEK